MGRLHKIPPFRAHSENSAEEEAERLKEPVEMEETSDTTWLLQLGAQRPGQHTQNLRRTKSDGFPVLWGEGGHKPTPPGQKLSQLITTHNGQTSCLSTESHRTCKPYLRTGSSPTRWQQAENKLNGIFGEVLFCLVMLCLFWFFFINFRGLLLLHYDFWFVCVNGLYMYMNVFLCVSLSFSAWMFCFILVLIICLGFFLFVLNLILFF